MKIYPEGLKTLIEEPSKGSRLQIPHSIVRLVKEFQRYHQEATSSHKLTREEVLTLMMLKGKEGIKKLICEYHIIIKNKIEIAEKEAEKKK